MKKILIASFDLEIGGVERSLINMLNNLDYGRYGVDLMLYSHTGEFFKFLSPMPNLLPENRGYRTIRRGIGEIFREGHYLIGGTRLLAKSLAYYFSGKKGAKESSYYQLQWMCSLSSPFFPKLEKEYDIAISYLWPHYYVLNNVKARKKIGWIHTDYSAIDIDVRKDLKMWSRLDHIIAVSEECASAFLKRYPSLASKVKVIENITSGEFIKKMSEEPVDDGETCSNKDTFNLLTVGRFSHAKGIDNGVRALKILRDKGYKEIKWYVIGYGGDEDMIRKLIEENDLKDSFIILGKKTNPYPHMKRCNLYVQPSRYEGKAVTVTEAQILGRAVLLTNYLTASSQVEHLEDGYITENSVKGIVSGIETLYMDEKLRKLLEKNCEKKNFSNNEELIKLYELVES